jgi:hypothetical protein
MFIFDQKKKETIPQKGIAMHKTSLILLVVISIISCKNETKFDYPLVYTGNITNITDTSAVFSARISNIGKSPIIESGFIWGVHLNDYNGIRVINPENMNGVYSLPTNEKLTPGKTYYVRAYVQTAPAISYGKEIPFKSSDGKINAGNWSLLYNDVKDKVWSGYIMSCFTINGNTYFTLTDGSLYSYNQATNTFSYILTNTLFAAAHHSFVFNDNAYLFTGSAIYLFNPQTKSLNMLTPFSGDGARTGVTGFLIKDNIYLGLGAGDLWKYSKGFWKYNITNNTWQQIASFPGDYRIHAFSFSMNGKGYVGSGYIMTSKNDLWCYIPETDKWIKKENLPFKIADQSTLNTTNTDKSGYCLYENKLYEYSAAFDTWEKMADLNIPANIHFPYAFTANNKLFTLAVMDLNIRYFKVWVYEK